MKTAISIPDDLFHEIESCSRQLKLSRSRLFAAAAREYLARHRRPADATEAWNHALGSASPDEERTTAAARRHGKAVIRRQIGKRR